MISISSHFTSLRNANPGYLAALGSGYVLMLTTMGVQFGLTPLYLRYLGEEQFGLLMVLLNLISFAAIGITWMSGGLVRCIGESWAENDLPTFRNLIGVGKFVYFFYALLLATVTCVTVVLITGSGADEFSTFILAGVYLVLHYEALPERQAFVGTDNQAVGNYIELGKVVCFGCVTSFLLLQLHDISAVWYGLGAGVLVQRVLGGRFWIGHVGRTGWRRFTPEMMTILRRLLGKQGVGYVTFGILLLLLQADTLLVSVVGGAEAAGQFVLLWKIPEALGLLFAKVPSVFEPRVISLDATGKHRDLGAIFRTGRTWYLILILAVSLFYMATGKWLAVFWVGDHAPDQDWMYLVGGAALFCRTFSRWPISFAYAMVRLPGLIKVTGVEVVGKIVMTVLLYPQLGIASPLLATILLHVVYVGWGYQRAVGFEGGRR